MAACRPTASSDYCTARVPTGSLSKPNRRATGGDSFWKHDRFATRMGALRFLSLWRRLRKRVAPAGGPCLNSAKRCFALGRVLAPLAPEKLPAPPQRIVRSPLNGLSPARAKRPPREPAHEDRVGGASRSPFAAQGWRFTYLFQVLPGNFPATGARARAPAQNSASRFSRRSTPTTIQIYASRHDHTPRYLQSAGATVCLSSFLFFLCYCILKRKMTMAIQKNFSASI